MALCRRDDQRAHFNMSNASADSVAPPYSSDVRFNSRTLLLVTIPVAVVAAVVGPVFRTLAPDEQLRVGVAWTGWLALVSACIFFVARSRIRIEKQAGRTIIRLPIYGMNPRWRRLNLCLLSGALALFGLLSLYFVAEQAIAAESIGGALIAAANFYAIFLAAMMAHSVAVWWWSRDIRLAEAGVLWDRRLMRWSNVRERWDPDRDVLRLQGLDQRNLELSCDVVVPDEEREKVAALLAEKLGANRPQLRNADTD